MMVSDGIKSPKWTVFDHAIFEDSGWYKADYNFVEPI